MNETSGGAPTCAQCHILMTWSRNEEEVVVFECPSCGATHWKVLPSEGPRVGGSVRVKTR